MSAAAEPNVTDGERQVTSNLLFQGRREVVIKANVDKVDADVAG